MIIILAVEPKIASTPAPVTFCSQESLDHNESLIGTAPRADVWFLLEYSGRWGNKALTESSIPDSVKEHLDEQMVGISEARLLLIKQSKTQHEDIAFYTALPKADPPALYRFLLSDYEELAGYDLRAITAQDERYAAARLDEPIFVICTNGLRDQCCAIHGVASYLTLAKDYPGMVWESTHHGGHRFAGNMLALPQGLSFGRMRPVKVAAVTGAALDGRIALDHLRGRTIYAEPVQAAEILLRREIGDDTIRAFELQGGEQVAEQRWKVVFRKDKTVHEVIVRRAEGPETVHISCGDEKANPVVYFHLEELRTQ
jgi:hypothetical protein